MVAKVKRTTIKLPITFFQASAIMKGILVTWQVLMDTMQLNVYGNIGNQLMCMGM
jgi:hypothetical protein